MNRNHPYFKSMTPVPAPAPNPVATPTVAYQPGYVPVMACVANPMWMDKRQEIKCLDTIFEKNNTYDPDTGYMIDGAGFIHNPYVVDDVYGGVIAAHAFDLDIENDKVRWAPVNIVNTEDAGLRYAYTNKNGCIKDVGPVESACIIGNYARPEGLYIPTCNTKAMADGMEILKEMIAIATKDDRDLPPFELDEIPVNVESKPISNGKLCAIDFGPDGIDIPEEVEMALMEAQKTGVYPIKHNCACGGNCKCKKDKKK